jgi:hypothetical protein
VKLEGKTILFSNRCRLVSPPLITASLKDNSFNYDDESGCIFCSLEIFEFA